jgi:hypothetical protein
VSTSFDAHFLGPDTHASRPSASAVPQGTKYSCTTHGLIEESDGVSTWSTWYGDVLGGSVSLSYGSNATHVAEIASAGASNAVARADHYHAGIAQATSSSSNTLQRGTLNLRAGTNVGLTATDTDGDGEFDTVTIHSTGGGSVGGGSVMGAAKYQRKTGNYTTTSTSFTDVDGTNLSLTITTGARRVLIGFSGGCSNSGADTLFFDVQVDGVRQGGDFGLTGENEGSNGYRNYSFTYLTDALSAGSHTFDLQWRNVNGTTSTMYGAASSATWPVFWVVEQQTA